jgi:hypothetical protein
MYFDHIPLFHFCPNRARLLSPLGAGGSAGYDFAFRSNLAFYHSWQRRTWFWFIRLNPAPYHSGSSVYSELYYAPF